MKYFYEKKKKKKHTTHFTFQVETILLNNTGKTKKSRMNKEINAS